MKNTTEKEEAMSKSRFELGQSVEITGTAEKVSHDTERFYQEADLPSTDLYPNKKFYSHGVIVGKRTVQDGGVTYDPEYGALFVPTAGTSQTVWIVSYSLHRKPVTCFDHQVKEYTK